MGKLEGKRALVTAGAQGIGLAITEHLLTAGCSVYLHYFSSKPNLEKLAQKALAGARVEAGQGDLRDEAEARRIVEAAATFLGGLDILINNAGSLIGRRQLSEIKEDFWRDTIDLNVSSMVWVTQAAAPHLTKNEGSSIVNLSSLAGRKGGHPGSLAYSTAKGAVLTWTRALANELGPKGVRVNAVAPGLILGTSFHNTHTTKESAQKTIEGIPLGRGGCPADVARAVCYLASEYDGFINGATLDINGGVWAA